MTSTVHPIVAAALTQPQYKGKVTHRSWPELPEEIIRLITTFYLHDLASTSYCPQTWEARKHWYSRMAYTCIRDSMELEKCLMPICPEWRKAIEKHLFWTQVLHVIDPNDHLLHHSVVYPSAQTNASSNTILAPRHLTPYQHLKNILRCTCVICRINHPLSNQGLATSKRQAMTLIFGSVQLCKEHDKNRTTYCGLCLRDSAIGMKTDSTSRDFDHQQQLGISENEDDETWPNVEMTCRKCRTEWLWRRASRDARDRDAVGGPSFQCLDWEARQSIDGFLDLAEGTITDVLILAREKFWLRMNTNYADLGNQLLASQKNEQRYNNPQVAEEEEEDSEEDRDAAFMSGSAQVREIALSHWARRRILDGHWLSPADIWYNNRNPGQNVVVPTVHPCPWAREGEDMDSTTGEEQQHPLKATVLGEVPPSFSLCEQAYLQHMKAIREVLGPPMKNLVRKLVMESQVPTAKGFPDPGQIARKMSLEDVIRTLREEEGMWYDGVDWLERKRNEDEENSRRQANEEAALMASVGDVQGRKEDDTDSSSSSAKSSSTGSRSNATSPVLSTTTLQTTPSPPPLSDEGNEPIKKDSLTASGVEVQETMLAARPRFIPFDPVKSPPRLLGTIPYIPVTIAHLPHYSLEAVKSAWREACAPLYHCTCSICERAKVVEMNLRAAAYAANVPAHTVPSQPNPQIQPPTRTGFLTLTVPSIDSAEVVLKEVSGYDVDGDGEEEIDYEASEYEEDDEEEEEEEEEDQNQNQEDDACYDDSGEYRYSLSPGPEPVPERPRKRSSDELEGPLPEAVETKADGGFRHDGPISARKLGLREQNGKSSPKRARIEESLNVDEEETAVREVPVGLPPLGPPLALGGGGDGSGGGVVWSAPDPSPGRLRKRSSEELDDTLGHEPPSPNKRVRVDRRTTAVAAAAAVAHPAGGNDFVEAPSPVSLAPSERSDIDGEDIVYSPVASDGEGDAEGSKHYQHQHHLQPYHVRERLGALVSQSDMDSLITLEDGDGSVGD